MKNHLVLWRVTVRLGFVHDGNLLSSEKRQIVLLSLAVSCVCTAHYKYIFNQFFSNSKTTVFTRFI